MPKHSILHWFLLLAAAPAVASEPPALRLPQTVKPVRYAIEATLDPAADSYAGRVDIDVDASAATDTVWLHAVNMEIATATIGGAPAKVTQKGDFLGLTPAAPFTGAARLRIDFKIKILDGTQAGIFRVREGKNAFLFSKLESIFARRAFPCFDEPGFKTPYRLTLHVRKEHLAVGNAPVESEKDESGGMKTVVFAETKPLPTYLFALAVGPFELVDAGRVGKKNTPIRIVVPAGMAKDAAWAARIAPELLARLERYFDIPYPYEKLDLAAMPSQPGAMENAALITFGTGRLLADPSRQTNAHRRSVAHIMAHEMAHLWFGDFVTMGWWDDLWLNEGFASWLDEKIVADWKPEWRADSAKAETRGKAIRADGLTTARKVRQAIETPDDIFSAFDAITYDKGASVLAMVEAWIGPDSFQKGVKGYLLAHAHGSATTADFVGAMSEAAGLDIGPVLTSFVDQPGAPVVSVELRCDKGTPRVSLTQARYLPAGVAPSSGSQTWRIPICVKYGPSARACMLMTGPHADLLLDETKVCPDYLLGNDGGVGYYRVRILDERLLERSLREPSLSLRERLVVLGDVEAQVEEGTLPAATVLRSLGTIAADRDPSVAVYAPKLAWSLSARMFVVPEMDDRWVKLVNRTFGERARKLGLRPVRGEDDDVQLLRDATVSLVAIEGRDKRMAKEAAGLARKWLDDRKSVDPDTAKTALFIAARTGDRELFEVMRAETNRNQDATERGLILSAMVNVGDPVLLRRGLDFLLSDEVQGGEAVVALMSAARADPIGGAVVREWARQSFDALMRKLPVQYKKMAMVPAGACDEASRRKHEQFFTSKLDQMSGGKRLLATVLQAIDVCVAARKVQEPSVIGFLRTQ